MDDIKAPVVMIHRKGLDNKTEKEKTKKYNFQGHYEGSTRWFDRDNEWLEEHFSIREPEFYKNLCKTNIEGQDMETYQIFVAPIGNAKIAE